jgi:molybdate transport system substrate-binding protein
VSELIHVPGVTFVGKLPDEIQPEVYFSGAITKMARDPEAAGALLRFLTSPDAAPVISKAGLTPLSRR